MKLIFEPRHVEHSMLSSEFFDIFMKGCTSGAVYSIDEIGLPNRKIAQIGDKKDAWIPRGLCWAAFATDEG